MKNIFIIFIIFISITSTVFAKNPVNITARVCHDLSVYDDTPEVVEFIINEPIEISFFEIPIYSTIKAEIYQFYHEQRWHKAGFVVCKVLSYETKDGTVDISDKNFYLYMRMHEPANPKQIAITATELTIMTGASFFAPGADIGYFFLKGAILRKYHPNWFKAGVSSAYDNSILWFIEKGKPLKLFAGEEIKLKYIPEEKAHDIEAKYAYKKFKTAFREEKKITKAEIKEIKRQEKAELKNTEYNVKARLAKGAGAAKIQEEK